MSNGKHYRSPKRLEKQISRDILPQQCPSAWMCLSPWIAHPRSSQVWFDWKWQLNMCPIGLMIEERISVFSLCQLVVSKYFLPFLQEYREIETGRFKHQVSSSCRLDHMTLSSACHLVMVLFTPKPRSKLLSCSSVLTFGHQPQGSFLQPLTGAAPQQPDFHLKGLRCRQMVNWIYSMCEERRKDFFFPLAD